MTTELVTELASNDARYKKAREVIGDHRKLFDSIDDAITALRKIFATENFPQSFPVVVAGVGGIDLTPEGVEPDIETWEIPAYKPDSGAKVALSFLGKRGIAQDDGTKVNGARGFVIYPLFSVESIMASGEDGENWLWKVAEKEGSHVAVRKLRNVPDSLGYDALTAAAKQMPVTVDAYVEESTSAGADTSAFDALWKDFRKLLREDPATAALDSDLPQKPEVIKAIRSTAYATENYGHLEEMGTFTFLAEMIIDLIETLRAAAIEEGKDFDIESGEIAGWLAGRDTKVFPATRKVEADLSKVDFAAFMARQKSLGTIGGGAKTE